MFTINAYITPRGAQGFTPHTDHQDVFILQLDGGPSPGPWPSWKFGGIYLQALPSRFNSGR